MREPSRKLVRDYSLAIGLAVAAALLIRFYVIEAYRIPSPAMKPALEPGDTIFVTKWPYRLRTPDRGDVVVFSFPSEPKRDYIKRVVGLPGDTVQIKSGHLALNGRAVAVSSEKRNAACGQERLPNERTFDVCWEPPLLEDFGPAKVGEGDVFVVGDLRSQGTNDTKTRKTWGMVPVGSIKGKAMWIWLSVEPQSFAQGVTTGWFPAFRFDRMFRTIR